MKQESIKKNNIHTVFYVVNHIFGGKVVILFQVFSVFYQVLSLHTN